MTDRSLPDRRPGPPHSQLRPGRTRPGADPEPPRQRVPNRRLAALIEEAGFSHAGLARRVDQLGLEHGLDLRYDKTSVTRWLRGAGIDPLNAEKVDLLELVWSNVLRIYDREAALAWLFGVNPLLGDRRPVDLIRLGRTEELMRAIRAERSDTFA